MKSMNGKDVVVTGAFGGIGSAIALQFSGEGAHLVLHYRSNREATLRLQRELGNCSTIVLHADLSKEPEVK